MRLDNFRPVPLPWQGKFVEFYVRNVLDKQVPVRAALALRTNAPPRFMLRKNCARCGQPFARSYESSGQRGNAAPGLKYCDRCA